VFGHWFLVLLHPAIIFFWNTSREPSALLPIRVSHFISAAPESASHELDGAAVSTSNFG
jgi:hypothetical protein